MAKRKQMQANVNDNNSSPKKQKTAEDSKEISKQITEQAKFENNITSFTLEKWQFSSGDLSEETNITTNSHANFRMVQSYFTPIKCFELMFTDAVWTLLVKVCNRNLLLQRKSKFRKPVTCDMLKEWYAIYIQLESNYSTKNRRMKEQIAKYSKSMGKNRYCAIANALIPSTEEFEELFLLLNTNFSTNWQVGQHVVFDETVFAYQPSKTVKAKQKELKDEIPTVYIPRKPHPNGLMVYNVATVSDRTGLPYILAMYPFFKFPQLSPREALITAAKQWRYVTPGHFIVDAAFGCMDLFEEKFEKPTYFTSSMPVTTIPHVWSVLKWNITPKQSQFAVKENENNVNPVIASCYCDVDDNDFKFHLVCSNAFNVQKIQASVTIDNEEESQVPPQAQVVAMTKDQLFELTIAELKVLCKQKGIKTSGTKVILVERMVPYFNMTSSTAVTIEQNKASCISGKKSGYNMLHSTYKENFNAVDRINRWWYMYDYKYKVCNWRAKLLFGTLKLSLINSWTLANEIKKIDYETFRDTIPAFLMP